MAEHPSPDFCDTRRSRLGVRVHLDLDFKLMTPQPHASRRLFHFPFDQADPQLSHRWKDQATVLSSVPSTSRLQCACRRLRITLHQAVPSKQTPAKTRLPFSAWRNQTVTPITMTASGRS